jgi:hypothetical protein
MGCTEHDTEVVSSLDAPWHETTGMVAIAIKMLEKIGMVHEIGCTYLTLAFCVTLGVVRLSSFDWRLGGADVLVGHQSHRAYVHTYINR